MTRRGAVEAMLRRYGEPVTAKGSEFCALIRPLRYKNGRGLNIPDRYLDDVYRLYTGPAARKQAAGDTVAAAEGSYAVRRSDTFLLSGEELYVWAVLFPLSPGADEEVRLERDGALLALAESYGVKAVRDAAAVVPWGGDGPAAVDPGAVRWELTLQNVLPQNGADPFAPGGFDVVVARGGEKVTYSGCRWKTAQCLGGPGREPRRSMEALAEKRISEKEGNRNG